MNAYFVMNRSLLLICI